MMSELPGLSHNSVEEPAPVIKLNTGACRVAFQNPETSATVLHAIVLTTYGFEAIYGTAEEPGMDPITLWECIRADFGADIDEHAQNRLQAIMLATSTNAFYEDPEVFYAVVCGMQHGDITDVMSGMGDDISLAEIGMTLWELGNARDDEPEMTDAVKDALLREIADEAEDTENGSVEGEFAKWRAGIIADLHEIGIPDEALAQLA